MATNNMKPMMPTCLWCACVCVVSLLMLFQCFGAWKRSNNTNGHTNLPPCGKECDLQDPEGVFVTRGQFMTFNCREVILDNINVNDHVSLTILYCHRDISMIMTN